MDEAVIPFVGTSNVQQSLPLVAFDCRLTIPCWPMPDSFAPSSACMAPNAAPAPARAATPATMAAILFGWIDPPR